MSNKNLWLKYKKYNCNLPKLGISLDISRVNFADNFFELNKALITKALSDLKSLESGERVNKTEDRMVGHYWLRAPELSPSVEIKNQILDLQKNIEDFSSKILKGQILSASTNKAFSTLLIIGIGGSALGPQLVYSALAANSVLSAKSGAKGLKTFIFDNTDPDGMYRTICQIPDESLATTLVLVVSKSGGTPETYNGQQFVWNYFKSKGITSPAKNFVAITGENSKLDNLAKEQNWLARFPMWDWVGGRTSIWSSVGLLPAALQGIDWKALLEGAKEMDGASRSSDILKNPSLLLALMWGQLSNWLGEKVMVVLPYKDRLSLLASYSQQLIMESLGKGQTLAGMPCKQGLSVFGNKGSTDQHSYVQQLREGVDNFFAMFVEVLKDESENSNKELSQLDSTTTIGNYLHSFLIGTRTALYENGRESLTFTLEKLDAKTLGAMLALLERAVTFYASMVNVNAYDQPGVEAGKKSAALVLEVQKKIQGLGLKEYKVEDAEGIAEKIGEEDILLVFDVVRYLAKN